MGLRWQQPTLLGAVEGVLMREQMSRPPFGPNQATARQFIVASCLYRQESRETHGLPSGSRGRRICWPIARQLVVLAVGVRLQLVLLLSTRFFRHQLIQTIQLVLLVDRSVGFLGAVECPARRSGSHALTTGTDLGGVQGESSRSVDTQTTRPF